MLWIWWATAIFILGVLISPFGPSFAVAEIAQTVALPIVTVNRNVYVDGIYDMCHIGHYKVGRLLAPICCVDLPCACTGLSL